VHGMPTFSVQTLILLLSEKDMTPARIELASM
jgi:hypothetical protein